MPREPERPVVNLRRAYFECRYGQLHVRTAFPSTGGFDERTPLVCLHEHPRSSRSFAALLTEIGSDRSAYACDTPGCGESDPPPAPPTIADYAVAIGDFFDALRLREADVLGVGMGAAIATELAIARPRGVRSLVLAAVPLGAAAGPRDPQPQPVPPAADGSHLLSEWRRSIAARGTGESLAALATGFAEELRNGSAVASGQRAIAAWPAATRLPLVAQRTLLLRPRDPGAESAAQAQRLLRSATVEELSDLGPGYLADAPGAIAARLRRFLDR